MFWFEQFIEGWTECLRSSIASVSSVLVINLVVVEVNSLY